MRVESQELRVKRQERQVVGAEPGTWMFRFQKLDVWRKASAFAGQVYAVTKSFPSDERFGLTSQMRRSAVSIAANIAEGSGRTSDADFARFVDIGYGSLMETLSHVCIARDQLFLSQQVHDSLFEAAEEIARMLSGLRSRLAGKDHLAGKHH